MAIAEDEPAAAEEEAAAAATSASSSAVAAAAGSLSLINNGRFRRTLTCRLRWVPGYRQQIIM